jgi:hypothetical protein
VGCALFAPLESGESLTTSRPLLPPLRTAANAIQLQIIFVDRPADDPVLNQLVWQEVDQVGATPPALRTVLQDNGLRVAQSGASVPPTLQALLGLASEAAPADAAAMSGRQLTLISGQASELVVRESLDTCTVRYVINSQEEAAEFQQARGLFRVCPVRLQDGWVRLEVTPEIHYGESRMRHTPTEEGWALKAGQNADARHALKFQVTLNSGEMLLVGAADAAPDTLGRRFFFHEQDGRMQQRLLVVRLADAGREVSAEP